MSAWLVFLGTAGPPLMVIAENAQAALLLVAREGVSVPGHVKALWFSDIRSGEKA